MLNVGKSMRTVSSKIKKTKSNLVSIQIPHGLHVRIEAIQKTTGLIPEEFVVDAISEKLASIHKERRKRKRI